MIFKPSDIPETYYGKYLCIRQGRFHLRDQEELLIRDLDIINYQTKCHK